MFRKLGSISLQYKLLMLLIVLPALTISMYLLLVLKLFKEDKIAYVFDSSMSVSKSLSTQVRSEINSISGVLTPILEGYNAEESKFDEISKKLFYQKKRIKLLLAYSKGLSTPWQKKAKLIAGIKKEEVPTTIPDSKNNADNDQANFTEDATILSLIKPLLISKLLNEAKQNQTAIRIADAERGLIWFAITFKNDKNDTLTAVLTIFEVTDLINVFKGATLYANYLVDRKGEAIFSPDVGHSDLKDSSFTKWDFYKTLKNKKMSEGTVEALSPLKNIWFVSFSEVRIGNYMVYSFVEQRKALRAMETLLKKSILFFVALISMSMIISFFSSRRLTGTLRKLLSATRKVSEGDFSINVEVNSRDEIGDLTDSFNKMAGEISRLMDETADKARMENELKTAKLVQDMLFPRTNTVVSPIEIAGHYAPASECGGDWWFYQDFGDSIYMWIGDATGHGAPAALVTSAAKSAVSIISEIPGITPGEALAKVNRAISETAHGKICMTFFVGAFHKHTGKLTYACAGHEPPLMIRNCDGPISKDDLLPLIDVNGKRCGEEISSTYNEAELQLSSGDTILFYTDGIVDVENPMGKKWSERKFLKSLVNGINECSNISETTNALVQDVKEFQDNAPLVDDITFFFCKFLKEEEISDATERVRVMNEAIPELPTDEISIEENEELPELPDNEITTPELPPFEEEDNKESTT